jgi:CRISPR-associated protein Cmr3
MTRIGLCLDPLDVLFFRDGRPFDPAIRASGGLPLPAPLAGALRTALLARTGFDFSRFTRLRRDRNNPVDVECALQQCGAAESIRRAQFRGPWIALRQDNQVEPLLPAPASLALDSAGWHRANPEAALLGWNTRQPRQEGLLPLWRRGAPEAKNKGELITLRGIRAYLDGGVPAREETLTAPDLFDFDRRTGIEVQPDTLTAAEGQIYGIQLLSLRPRVKEGHNRGWRICLYAEVLPVAGSLPDLAGPLPLGGEGHYVHVELVQPVDWPGVRSGSRALWLLATPAPVQPGQSWPAGLPEHQLQAAASLAPLAFSGWDVARGGPHPARFAVPAGSVYFVNGDWAPARDSVCTADEDVAQGWGFALQGDWK